MLPKTDPDSLRARRSPGHSLSVLLLAAATLCFPRTAAAEDQSSLNVAGVMRSVALDPTTYAPALLSYDAMLRDWDSSQIFFANGFREWNERFTISGMPNDVPVRYEVGRQRILKDAIVTFQLSVLTNFAVRTTEALLVERYPDQGRLIKTLGWIERVGLASFISYRLSAAHYHQARHNAALAQSLGLK
jgi:hypothetical protein